MPYLKNNFKIEFTQSTPGQAVQIPLSEVNNKVFHLYGIDILIDEDFNPWVLEINSNPSFNINIQKFEKVEDLIEKKTNFKVKNEVSEIDKYIKANVISDAFKIIQNLYDDDSDEKENYFELLYPQK